MTLRAPALAVVAILGCGAAAGQDVYHYVDEAGRPVFTDQPPQGQEAERLDLPSPGDAGGDPERRLQRIRETATLLREDREAREARRDGLRRESARRAHEEAMEKAVADAAREPRVVSGGWYPAWGPGYGRWPGWQPWFRPPGHVPRPPAWRPPHRPEFQSPPGGVLRPGPGSKGW